MKLNLNLNLKQREKYLPGSLEMATPDAGVARPGSADKQTCVHLEQSESEVGLEMWTFSFFSVSF